MSQASVALRTGEDPNVPNQVRGAPAASAFPGDFDLPELI